MSCRSVGTSFSLDQSRAVSLAVLAKVEPSVEPALVNMIALTTNNIVTPKLASMAKEGLPPNLRAVHIYQQNARKLLGESRTSSGNHGFDRLSLTVVSFGNPQKTDLFFLIVNYPDRVLT